MSEGAERAIRRTTSEDGQVARWGSGKAPTGGVTDATLEGAYQHCEQVTKTEARNFSYGIRLLPGPKRRALSAVYALARRIDDIGDGTLPAEEKIEQLGQVRADLQALDQPGDQVLVALAHAARTYPIPLAAFDELIDGCEADVRGTPYPTFDALEHYCRCVAGSVGRLSLGIFGVARTPAGTDEPAVLADRLGIALQLTNILRDILEDRRAGRVYLPAEDLQRFGCTLELDGAGRITDPPDRLSALIRSEVARAEEWYADGLRLLALLDRRSAACTGAMAGIYHRLLADIRADPLAVTRTRVRLSGWHKARVAARALALGRA